MKKITTLIITGVVLLWPMFCYAQSSPQPPAEWIVFQEHEKTKISAYFKQLIEDKEAFLKAHPNVKAYLDQLKARSKAKISAMQAQQPKTQQPQH